MKIEKAVFVKSWADGAAYSGGDLPEVCVVGRSNVGKSTFINMLTGARLAKTSSEPGRTRLINVFRINDSFNLIDLPGYGFAKASKRERSRWSELAEEYFRAAVNLKRTFVLMDIRHDPSELDKQMLSYLYYYTMPFTVIATKCDKLSRAAANIRWQRMASVLGIGKDDIVPVSFKGGGRDEVLAIIEAVV